uniref:Uncharacterized protein n=2 Tax=Avena sativa TaxID=4498 RepID=A0ACD5VKK1_AVESA
MELPSEQRLRRSTTPPPPHGTADPDEDDRLSPLPDDMLLQILARLGCVRSAARADVLSRRWRGLWTRLPDLAFRDVPAGEIQAALTRVALPGVSVLDVRLPRCRSPAQCKLDDSRAKSLLRATARLSPKILVLELPDCYHVKLGRPVEIILPHFHRTMSIELDTHLLRIKPPRAGEFPMLETLSIAGNIADLGALLDCCPRLRLLKVTFRGVDHASLKAGLATLEAAVAHGLVVSLLGINGNVGRHRVESSSFALILNAVVRVYPREFIFTNKFLEYVDVNLPCFHHTMLIEMNLYPVYFKQLQDGVFLTLERLTISESRGVVDLASLVTRCPRLRVLKVTTDTCNNVTIHSASLQEIELDLFGDNECQGIDIATSFLEKLKLIVRASTNLRVSILAPMVEKVSLLCMYANGEYPLMFGFWLLQRMRLDPIDNYKGKYDAVLNNKAEDACSQQPSSHVLSLDISASNRLHFGVILDIAQEMEKFMVTNFSVLEPRLNPKGHAFASFVFRLLRMRHIRTVARRLKVVLPWFEESKTPKCLGNCPCNEPENWRSESISLTYLEEVEIEYLRGGDHHIELVRLIFGSAPMLKRMTIKLADEIKQREIGSYATTIHNICLAYPSVDCSIYISSGERCPCHSGRQA